MRNWLCLVAALNAGCSGCTSGGDDARDAIADSAADGESGGTGGGGIGGNPSGGVGGGADASPDGSPGEPAWGPALGKLVGCTFARLLNPEQVQVFTWKPCGGGTQHCEQAVFHPSLWVESGGAGVETWLQPGTWVHDGGAGRASLLIGRNQSPMYMIVTDESGRAIDGYRVSTQASIEWCRDTCTGLWGDRFGIMVERDKGAIEADFGLLLSKVGQQQAPPLQQLATPPIGGPQLCPMGTKRWAYWWVPGARIVTIDNATGGDLQVAAASNELSGPIWDLGFPVSAGDHFLFERSISGASPGMHREIMITDGVADTRTYLVPPAGSDYAAVSFADTHVVWQKGINPVAPNTYDSVEIWFSKYSPDPQKLVPEKLSESEWKSMAIPGPAGWGHYADFHADSNLRVWNLTTKQSVTRTFPPGITVWRTFGMTKTHVWTGGREGTNNAGDYLLRFTVE